MAEQFANDVETTLNGAIDDNDTTLVVTSATGFPTTGDFRIRIDDEIMTVTAVSGTTFTISRATEAVGGVQTAASHSNGAAIKHVLTAGALQNFALPTGTIGAKALRNTTTSLTTGVSTDLAYALTDEFDTDGFHDPSTNSERMTIPAGLGGKYLCIANNRFGANATGHRELQFIKNNTTGYTGQRLGAGSSVNSLILEALAVIDLAAGDFLEVSAMQSSGGNLDALDGSFTIIKLDSGRVGTGIGARASKSGVQTISTGTWTAITFNGTDFFDTNGFHDPSSNNSRMTIPTGLSGKYIVSFDVLFDGASSTGSRYLTLYKNGSNESYNYRRPGESLDNGLARTLVLDLISSDFIEVYVHQDSGGDLNIDGASFSIARLDSLPPITQGQWQTYTPALTASTTNPTVGNASLLGRWKYIDNKTIALQINFTFGSTSSAGSGEWAFSLPSGITAGSLRQAVNFILTDNGSGWYVGHGYIGGGATKITPLLYNLAPSTGLSIGAAELRHDTPFTWATNDFITINGIIEIV